MEGQEALSREEGGLWALLPVCLHFFVCFCFLAIRKLGASHCTKWKLFGAIATVIHFADGNSEAR